MSVRQKETRGKDAGDAGDRRLGPGARRLYSSQVVLLLLSTALCVVSLEFAHYPRRDYGGTANRWNSQSHAPNSAQLGNNGISIFIKLSMPSKCVIFNVEYIHQYLR